MGKSLIFALAVGALSAQVTVRTVCPSGCQYANAQLQNAVNDAQPGDIISLDPSIPIATVSGLTIPAKVAGGRILIRSANIYSLPPTGTRVSPNDPNLATVTYAARGYLDMRINAQAANYVFQGINFSVLKGDAPTNLIQFGQVVAGSTWDNDPATLAENFTFDRDVFSGWPGIAGPYRAIAANVKRLKIKDSYFDEIKGITSESQDVGAWNSPGPFYLRNNHFESSTMETLFGGAQPTITGIRASDSWFVGNEYYRPWSWRLRGSWGNDLQGQPPTTANVCMSDGRGGEWWFDTKTPFDGTTPTLFNCQGGQWLPATEAQLAAVYPFGTTGAKASSGAGAPTGTCTSPSYYKDTASTAYYACSGTAWAPMTLGNWAKTFYSPWFEKNHFELKNAQRVMVEGNYIHQAWNPANLNQHGACILFNQVDGSNNTGGPPRSEPAAIVANVEVRFNHCDQTPWGISNGYIGNYFWPTREIDVHDNLFTNLGNEPFSLGDAQVIQLGAQGRYSFRYNTATGSQPTGGFSSDMAQETTHPEMQQIEYEGNIVPFNKLGIYDEHGHGNLWDAVDNNWNLNRSFTRNVIVDNQGVGMFGKNLQTKSDKPPFSGQVPCSSCASAPNFAAVLGSDYKPLAPYNGWWAHGRPAGADIDQVNWSTAHAIDGKPNQFLDFRIRTIFPTATLVTLNYTAPDQTACTATISTTPDFANSASVSDSGGARDRTLQLPVNAGTPYFLSLACAGYTRYDTFLSRLQ